MVMETYIIKALIENKGDMNISKLAKIAGKDYKTAHTIVKRLEKAGILKTTTFGKSAKIELIPVPNPLIYQAEYERRTEILKNKNLKVMLDSFISGLKTKLFILLLFGSYAKKTAKNNSDIDLLFIVPDEIKEINRIADTIPLDLHINIFSEAEFIEMKNSKKMTVGSEAIANNVILHGIESYYELIK
jgi:predicted nucleotidyltransferase